MIHDKYTYAPISRQRKYQLRMRDKHKCIICGESATNSHFCVIHANKANELAKAHYHKTKQDDMVST
jgi:hypothetical protein